MGSRQRLLWGLLLAACVASSTVEASTFLADMLVKSKSGTAKVQGTGASTTDYHQTEVACLQQQDSRNCRYTGCPVWQQFEQCGTGGANNCERCKPDSIVLQTDLTCCPKDDYSNYNHPSMDSVLGFSDKVATCDWQFSLYRWGQDDQYWPFPTDDDTALKFGTAVGTCYFNAEAEHCDSPLCERMALSVVGGLYVSCAYSNEAESTLAELKDSCNEQDAIPPQTDTGNTAGTSLAEAINNLLNIADDFLPCGSTYNQRSTGSKKAASTPAAAAAVGVAAESHEDYYNGLAVIVSGVFHQTSKHGAKIADNGLLEFTFKFRDGVKAQPVNNWPVVTGGGMKLRFTRNDNYYASQN